MKELSIEQKAKRYDEAIERAKKVLLDCTPEERKVVEYISPELADSEDEKMLKQLRDFFKNHIDSVYEEIDNNNDVLAWLEKRGEHNSFSWTEDDEAKVKAMCEEGNLKPSEKVWLNNLRYRVTEKNPTDNVEPKFKVGEWVVSPNGVYWHVDAIQDGRYQVSSNSGECTDWSLNTNIYHKFTIQDEKDGDVLSYRGGQWIFIYKEKINDNSFYYHTLYSTIHKDLTIKDAGYTLLVGAITPATKEQRDFLFQKMKEAGYEWDAKKKELKKIEQKPAWSEEDEHNLFELVNELEYRSGLYQLQHKDYSQIIKWLKSLKERYAWKPSEGQIKMLENVRKILHTNKDIYSKANNLMYNFEEFIRTLEILKK